MDEQVLSRQLDNYLQRLSDVNERWSAWLNQMEQAIGQIDLNLLSQLAPVAQSLTQELQELTDTRTELLKSAAQLGLPNANLNAAAQKLKMWHQGRLRDRLRSARGQLARLRRMHTSTWVLTSQILRYYREVMNLLIEGKTEPSVYVANRHADTGGGRLLDASL
ncbi:MAG: hypothetical protein KDB22_09670 [Planctomycetales bacterium]|nr:hypothetical protein [Planctomycetales bacterium]